MRSEGRTWSCSSSRTLVIDTLARAANTSCDQPRAARCPHPNVDRSSARSSGGTSPDRRGSADGPAPASRVGGGSLLGAGRQRARVCWRWLCAELPPELPRAPGDADYYGDVARVYLFARLHEERVRDVEDADSRWRRNARELREWREELRSIDPGAFAFVPPLPDTLAEELAALSPPTRGRSLIPPEMRGPPPNRPPRRRR